MEKPHVSALRRAIVLAGGTQASLAEGLAKAMQRPISQQHVSYWLQNEVLLDAEYWPAFESVTDQQVTRRHLRPDIFGRDKAA